MKTVGSLFSGIGGLDLGLEWAGWRVVWQAETNPYASRVLAKHWPDVPNLGDVTEIDWENVRRPDLVCAGFPCQPVSHAGARRGDQDDRWLWPEVERCVRMVRPEWVLLENVPGLLTLGFGQVATDLAGLGYDLRWDCIPAAAVGAPHLRYRIFVVAHAGRGRYGHPDQPVCAGRHRAVASGPDVAHADRDSEPGVTVDALEGCGQLVSVADTVKPGREDRLRTGEGPPEPCRDSTVVRRCTGVADTDQGRRGRRSRQPRPGRGRQPADSGWWEFEPAVGRVAHGIPNRVDRLRCLGNAVVPQVAELVARMWLP